MQEREYTDIKSQMLKGFPYVYQTSSPNITKLRVIVGETNQFFPKD